MPILENPKHEAFCQAYIKNRDNATQAYIEAGYDVEGHSAEASGSRLLNNVEVKARIEELRQEVQKEDLVTMEEAITALKRLAKTAEADNQIVAAKGCWDSLVKTMGGFIDKKEVTGANGGPIEQKQITYSVVDTDKP